MKNKKLASLFLAIAMVLSLAVPAFANETTTNPNEKTTAFEGSTQMYTIKLTIASTGKLIVNPYGIAATVTGFEDPVTSQIITPATFITNHTDVKLKASAKITVTPTNIVLLDEQAKVNAASADAYLGTYVKGGAEDGSEDTWTPETQTVDSATVLKETKYVPKGVFLAFEMMETSDAETQPTSWTAADAIPANTEDTNNAGAFKGSTMVLASGDNYLNDCLTLAARGADDDDNYAAFHFTGLVNAYPKKANGTVATTASTATTAVTGATAKNYPTAVTEDDPWTAADKIDATVVLTFTPDVVPTTYTTPGAGTGSGQ